MKYTTRLKILHWVDRLLKLNLVKSKPLYIEPHRRMMRIVRVTHRYNTKEIEIIPESFILEELMMACAKEILNHRDLFKVFTKPIGAYSADGLGEIIEYEVCITLLENEKNK